MSRRDRVIPATRHRCYALSGAVLTAWQADRAYPLLRRRDLPALANSPAPRWWRRIVEAWR
jgi:hypothetical protein